MVTDSVASKLRKHWKPGDGAGRSNENALRAWMKAHGLDSKDIASFLYMDIFRDARKKALQDIDAQTTASEFGSGDAALLRRFWKPKGRISTGNKETIVNALGKINAREGAVSHFLYHPKHKDHRRRVVKMLGLSRGR